MNIEPTETVLTLTFLISEQISVDPSDFLLKVDNRILNDSSVKIGDLVEQLGSNIKVVLRSKAAEKEKRPAEQSGIEAMINSPMMKSMLKDKNLMKSMLKMNPKLKEQLEKNPDLRGTINSDFLEAELDKISEDPAYLKEQIQNTDLQMRNLENIPGGLDLMNNMMDRISTDIKIVPDGKKYFDKFGKPVDNLVSEPLCFKEEFYSPQKRSKAEKENLLFKYSKQLTTLKRNGFKDFFRNVEALKKSKGDVENAVKILCETE